MTGTFSLEGVDDTSEAHEEAWNGWVGELASRGLEPHGEPVAFTDGTATFPLREIATAKSSVSA